VGYHAMCFDVKLIHFVPDANC